MSTLKQTLSAFLLLFIVFACQDDTTTEVGVNEIDEDMLAANQLANEYLATQGGRAEDIELSVTVLKYLDGQLYYDTNTDTIEGYQVITEETVTATVNPGELVFWYSGNGLSELDGIDFDSSSESFLGDDSDEIYQDVMWKIMLPEQTDPDQKFLKYDIIYQFEGNTGAPIRLDPKIRVQPAVE